MRDDVERFISQGKVAGWAAASVSLYRNELEGMVGFVARRGCRRIADVTPGDLDGYLRQLLDLGRARTSRVHIAGTIRRFFLWLQDEGRVVANPARSLPVPEDGEEELPQPPLSEAEVRALFDGLPRATAIDLRNRCFLELLYCCGLRISEAVGLDAGDVDPGERTLHVRNGKGSQERLLPVMGTALAAVKDWLALRRDLLRGPDRGALFLNQTGRRLAKGSMTEWISSLNAARGPDARHLHAHLFRHSIAVHLLRGGADVRHVQEFLGHACLDTTKIYLRMLPGRLKEEYERAMPEIAVNVGVVWE
jgi:site-specific recombinase XerD